MLAAVYRGDGVIAVEDIPRPEVGPGQVLIEVSHCGICGSDLHMVIEGWGQPGSVGGHEYSGTVVEVGAEVKGWALGDRAVGGPDRGCGCCPPCRDGRPNLCTGRGRSGVDPYQGAFATHKVVDASALYRVPDGMDLRTAALTEPLAVAMHGIRRTTVAPGDRVLVTGAGPIGLLTVAALHSAGVSDITVSEPGEGRQALATQVGAARVVDPEELVTPEMPMDVVAEPYRVAFECSGRSDAMESALGQLGRAGSLVLLGTGMRRPRFDANRIILNEVQITGAVEYTPDDYEAALELLASGRLPTELLIDPDDQPLGRLQWAMERLANGELAGKVMVVPHA